MKKLFLLTGGIVLIASCNMHNYLPGFDFALFENTPVWKLAKAVEKEDTNQIAEILKDTNIKIDYQEPKFNNTLLMLAVVNNEKKSVKKLLQLGANPNKRAKYDNSNAMLVSCEYNDVDSDTAILKLLIKYGGDVNSVQKYSYVDSASGVSYDRETTVLILAIRHYLSNLSKVKILVENGADINFYTDDHNYGAITEALIHDHLEIAKYLIIDRQAKIPAYISYRPANLSHEGEPEEYLTVTDMLKENFNNYHRHDTDSANYKLREEILSYLKSKGFK